MKKEIYDNIDFNYPHCGGIKIWETKKNIIVKLYSNFCGEYTGDTYRIPLDASYWILTKIKNPPIDDPNNYLLKEEVRGFWESGACKKIIKGIKVN